MAWRETWSSTTHQGNKHPSEGIIRNLYVDSCTKLHCFIRYRTVSVLKTGWWFQPIWGRKAKSLPSGYLTYPLDPSGKLT